VNLALKDVRFQWPRFAATGLGLGLLFTIVLAMGGIYRGLVEEALLLAQNLDADLWIVQRDTRGPFAERSVLPPDTEARAQVVAGVASARAFTYSFVQREHRGRPLRLGLVGLSWPTDHGDTLPLAAGRPLHSAHYEMMADQTLGLSLGETVRLADDNYTVVGLTRGMVSSSGDGVAFLTRADAQHVESYLSPESLRLARAVRTGTPFPAPFGTEAASAAAPQVSAILVKVAPGASVGDVQRTFEGWPDVTVYSAAAQRNLLLQVVDKPRRQILLFRTLLVIISGIVVSLILYNMTVARTHEIGVLKLMGTRTRTLVGMILQQAFMLWAGGYAVALVLAALTFDRFPRKVVLTPGEIAMVAGVVLAVCLIGGLAGVVRALRIPANLVLAS
jgi:putative ABC transport system permease protein